MQLAAVKAVADEAVQTAKAAQTAADVLKAAKEVESSASHRAAQQKLLAQAVQPSLDNITGLIERMSDKQREVESKVASMQKDLGEETEARAEEVAGIQDRLTTVNTSCSTLSAQVTAVAQMAKMRSVNGAYDNEAAEEAAQQALRTAQDVEKEVALIKGKVTVLEQSETTKSRNIDSHSTATISPSAPDSSELAARIRVLEDELGALRLRQQEAEMVASSLVGGTVPTDQLTPVLRRLAEVEGVLMEVQAGKKAIDVTTLTELAALHVSEELMRPCMHRMCVFMCVCMCTE